jgi:EAL domain-containing protein (putative c-di-GMP-specific phosphodiesterase class I)
MRNRHCSNRTLPHVTAKPSLGTACGARDPAGVLDAVAAARAGGVGVAIDDVGADPASLAMMPLVRPDVIKLDLSFRPLRRQRARRLF